MSKKSSARRTSLDDGTVKYKGVTTTKNPLIFRAQIVIGQKHISLGSGQDRRELAEKFDMAQVEHYGDRTDILSRLNFPDKFDYYKKILENRKQFRTEKPGKAEVAVPPFEETVAGDKEEVIDTADQSTTSSMSADEQQAASAASDTTRIHGKVCVSLVSARFVVNRTSGQMLNIATDKGLSAMIPSFLLAGALKKDGDLIDIAFSADRIVIERLPEGVLKLYSETGITDEGIGFEFEILLPASMLAEVVS